MQNEHDFISEENEFNLVFNGDVDQIDASIVASALIDFTNAIKSYHRYKVEEYDIVVRVKTFRPGSFDIPFILLPNLLQAGIFNTVLNKESFSALKEYAGGISEVLKLKKLLGGEKPASVTPVKNQTKTVEVANNNGSITQVNIENLNFYNSSPETLSTLGNLFARVQNQPDIDSLEIRDKEKKSLFKADKDDIKELAKPTSPSKQQDVPKENLKLVENAKLNIFKFVLAENFKWECVYEGNRIHVKISDDGFFQRIRRKEITFLHGDLLKGNLHISQIWNEVAGVYENRGGYELTDVELIHQAEQQSLDFDQEINN